MSPVTILWSMAATAALLLGFVHGLIWLFDRRAWANLAFAITALSVAAMVPFELAMMHSQSPQEWGEWVRWDHVPIFFATLGTVLFVRLYLGAGRWPLIWAIVVLRCVILLKNFVTAPNFNFARIERIDRVPFLGETVSVLGEGVTSPWQWLAMLYGVLFVVYVADASITLWRRGGHDNHRRAAIVGGGIFAFIALSILEANVVIWGIRQTPVMIAFPFLIMLFAMACELSRDIVRAPRLARELGESEQRLELAASAAGLGLWAWSIDQNRIWTTERARCLFGCNDDNLDVERWLARVHPEDAGLVRRKMSAALALGHECDAEYRICDRNGETRWISVRGRSAPDAWGRTALMRGVVRDITDQVQARNESDELRHELAHAGRISMLGQLASALAHELSQPLGAILRNTEAATLMLHDSSLDLEELRAIVADIHKDNRRAGDVIERLRSLLKRRCIDFQPFAMDGLVQDVSSLVRPDATARQISLECTVAQGLPKISGDRVHLSQVLLNLIINGMDAIAAGNRPKGSVTVAAQSATGDLIEVAVTDSGSGIPAHMLARIFEPFFTTKPNGMGMGLAVSRTIIEAHGGRLWAENNTTGGATFRFTIPTQKEDGDGYHGDGLSRGR